jgi:multidrug efflux pump subunit AcrA (membrane-fusion protein)
MKHNIAVKPTSVLKKLQGDERRYPLTRLCCLLSVVPLMALITACASAPEALDPVSRPVRVMEVTTETHPQVLVFTGEVQAAETVQVSFPVSGRIEQLLVEEEMVITSDVLLGSIEPLDYQIAVHAAQAQLDAAQSNLNRAVAGAPIQEIRQAELQVALSSDVYDFSLEQLHRMQSLYDAGGVSRLELDAAELETATARTNYEQAQEQLDRLRRGALPDEIASLTALRDAASAELRYHETQLGQTQLKAPGSGVVAAVFYQEGEIYQPGTPLLMLKSETAVVSISASREELKSITPGDAARIKVNDQQFGGTVALVSSTPDPLTRTYRIEISLPAGHYVTGEIARAEIEKAGIPGMLIPMKAVMVGNPDYVFVIEDHKARQTPVQIQRVEGSRIRVTGLQDGQMVVIEGMQLLSHGEPVQLSESGDRP